MPARTSKNLGFASVLQKSGGPPPAPYKTSASPRFWLYFRLEIKKNSIRTTARMLDALAYVIWLQNHVTYVEYLNLRVAALWHPFFTKK